MKFNFIHKIQDDISYLSLKSYYSLRIAIIDYQISQLITNLTDALTFYRTKL